MISTKINELSTDEINKIKKFNKELMTMPDDYKTIQEIYLNYKIKRNIDSMKLDLNNKENNSGSKNKEVINDIITDSNLKDTNNNYNNYNKVDDEVYDLNVNGVTKVKKAEIYRESILNTDKNQNKFNQFLNRKHRNLKK